MNIKNFCISGATGITLGLLTGCVEPEPTELPNILWITCEDISPYLGSYGCTKAHTPHLDRLASKGIRYTNAFANAPVCAVARSTILTGMYASTTGTHQMRARTQLPPEIPAYPKIFKEAGYYTTNNVKTDYNSSFEGDPTVWDESSRTAHYRDRKEGQPFFAVFNITETHESQLAEDRIRAYVASNRIPEQPRIDPQSIELPPYHPDLPAIRYDWARFHDLITLMDSMVGDLLQELDEEGLADNTIVFFYSDHGGMLARSKRYIYNVGTQVPMIVYLPEKWRHLSKKPPGSADDRLVSFVDLARTVLSVAGLEAPAIMQGTAFLGKAKGKAPEHVYFFRDRMSERYDFSRAVTDGHYYFIRNFFPHRPPGRDSRYGFNVQANWRAWEEAYDRGECNDIQSQFFQPKATVELFDTKQDPWHINNIVYQSGLHTTITKLSDALDKWMVETRDIGLIPEPMFHQLAGSGQKYPTLYEYAQSDDYPVAEILEVAKSASKGEKVNISMYVGNMSHHHPVIRFWGAYGLFLARSSGAEVQHALKQMIRDDGFAANRIMAAQALALCGDPDTAFQSLMEEIEMTTVGYVMLQAINALQYGLLDDRLELSDWNDLRNKKFENDFGAQFALRIIDDAVSLYPARRIVSANE
jgi:arylsulfatase A-like enzyme